MPADARLLRMVEACIYVILHKFKLYPQAAFAKTRWHPQGAQAEFFSRPSGKLRLSSGGKQHNDAKSFIRQAIDVWQCQSPSVQKYIKHLVEMMQSDTSEAARMSIVRQDGTILWGCVFDWSRVTHAVTDSDLMSTIVRLNNMPAPKYEGTDHELTWRFEVRLSTNDA